MDFYSDGDGSYCDDANKLIFEWGGGARVTRGLASYEEGDVVVSGSGEGGAQCRNGMIMVMVVVVA